jgi:hypothetical protein
LQTQLLEVKEKSDKFTFKLKWKEHFYFQALLLGISLCIAIPLFLSLFGISSWIRENLFDYLMESSLFRQITGFMGLAIVLVEFLFSIRKRFKFNFGLSFSYSIWRLVHIFSGILFLLLIVIHTGCQWGHNLNGWLLSAFTLVVFVALTGQLLETKRLNEQIQMKILRKTRELPVLRRGLAKFFADRWKQLSIKQIKTVWLKLHIIFVSIFIVLLLFHIFCAYYF